jgi:hypothetical protein
MPSGSIGPDFAQALSQAIREHLSRWGESGMELSRKTGMSQDYFSKRLRDEAPFTMNDVENVTGCGSRCCG